MQRLFCKKTDAALSPNGLVENAALFFTKVGGWICMRNERNSLRQAAITAGILAALGVCTLGGGPAEGMGGRAF